MAYPLFIAQQLFSQLHKSMSQSDIPEASQCTNSTQLMPQDFPSLVNFFFSSSAAIEWMKILVYGSLLEMFRRLVFYIYARVYNSFFITATFKEDDTSFSWMCYWLSRHSAWRTARDLEVSTDSFGFDDDASMIEGEVEDPSTVLRGGRQLAFLPAEDTVHTMWYKGHWVRVKRFTREGSYQRRRKYLELCILARSHSVLNNILIDSKKAYQVAQRDLIRVFVANDNSWRLLSTRPKRSFSSIILDPGMKDILINDAKDFLSSKAWYTTRGIPFRRGYLLHGAPGSGKTSVIQSLAGELGLDVYIISLSRSGMDDTALSELIIDLPEKCIALMEDIDAAFSQTINRESNLPQNDSDEDEDNSKKSSTTQPDPPHRPTSNISLSGLLNALDGVGAQEGRILFATTNKYDSLDPALSRPGRMDVHMEFKLASRYQARQLFRCFYLPDWDLKEQETKTEDANGDSGHSSHAEDEKEQKIDIQDPPSQADFMRSPSPAELEKLAEEFADAIPEREFSMATLQGYLMKYKVSPVAAVKEARMWVTKEREDSRVVKNMRKDEKLVPVEASDT